MTSGLFYSLSAAPPCTPSVTLSFVVLRGESGGDAAARQSRVLLVLAADQLLVCVYIYVCVLTVCVLYSLTTVPKVAGVFVVKTQRGIKNKSPRSAGSVSVGVKRLFVWDDLLLSCCC